jgi:hypothetical protein
MVEGMSSPEPSAGHAWSTRREVGSAPPTAPLRRWLSNRGEHAGSIEHQVRFRSLSDDTLPNLSLDGILGQSNS